MYNVNSKKAEEFISHEEILETLKYAEENCDNIELIDSIIEKAKEKSGIAKLQIPVNAITIINIGLTILALTADSPKIKAPIIPIVWPKGEGTLT